jgi:hypothetical protein
MTQHDQAFPPFALSLSQNVVFGLCVRFSTLIFEVLRGDGTSDDDDASSKATAACCPRRSVAAKPVIETPGWSEVIYVTFSPVVVSPVVLPPPPAVGDTLEEEGLSNNKGSTDLLWLNNDGEAPGKMAAAAGSGVLRAPPEGRGEEQAVAAGDRSLGGLSVLMQ